MTTYYLAPSPTGSDSNAGTLISPWLTIQKFFSSSTTGDTAVVAAGTYTTWSTSSTFNSARTVIGASSETTIIDYGNAEVEIKYTNWVISNLQFKNAVGSSSSISGIFYLQGGTNSLTNCILNNCNVGNVSGVAQSGVFGNFNETSTIDLNACVLNNCGTVLVNGPLIRSIFGTITVNIVNCTFYSNLADGITACIVGGEGSGGGILINAKNTIFYNANGVNKSWQTVGSGETVTYTGSTNNDVLGYSSAPSFSSSISSDPLFVDPANLNFNLRPTSPCVGAGTLI